MPYSFLEDCAAEMHQAWVNQAQQFADPISSAWNRPYRELDREKQVILLAMAQAMLERFKDKARIIAEGFCKNNLRDYPRPVQDNLISDIEHSIEELRDIGYEQYATKPEDGDGNAEPGGTGGDPG